MGKGEEHVGEGRKRLPENGSGEVRPGEMGRGGGRERRRGDKSGRGEVERKGERGGKRWQGESGRVERGGGRETQRQRHKTLRWGWWRSDRWMQRGHWGQTGQTQVEEAAGRTKTTRHQPW